MKVALTTDFLDTVEHHKGVSRYILELAPRVAELVEVVGPDEADLIHVMAPRVRYSPLLRSDTPTVLTVHGLDFHIPSKFRAPWHYPKDRIWQTVIPRICRWADHYLVSTNFLAGEIDRENVSVVPFGVDDWFHDFGPPDQPDRYIVTDTPTTAVATAWEILSEHVDHELIIVGKRGYGMSRFDDWIGVSNPYHHVGFVSDRDSYASIIAGADAMLHWSGYETFGFPPVESMALGTATVTNDAGSLPEVVGDGGITVSSAPEAARELLWLIVNDSHRRRLESAGRSWSRRYDWGKTAEGTVEVYRRVLDGCAI